jgi:uncharacterized radical SAM superfamily Fe-S cluster-containing enzyme
MQRIEVKIVEQENGVYLTKECKNHGAFKLLLSRHSWYYKGLNDFYFSLIQNSFPQRDYIINLTNRCNLVCPICLADSNQRENGDLPLEKLKEFLKDKSNFKIDLMGAEPTMRNDLPEIIRIVKESGNLAALHTNGIAISEFNYLKDLKKAGLTEIHLQFDGFSDKIYEEIRGRSLLNVKLKALENLEKLRIATDLKVTIVRGINENQMLPILSYASEHDFVKEVFFLGCRFLGKAKQLPYERCIMPDELIDLLEQQTEGRINRPQVFKFQKLYFSLLAGFSIKKCFYNQHFLITRDKRDFIPIDKIINLEKAEKIADKFRQISLKNKKLALLYLITNLFLFLLPARNWFLIKDFLILGNLWTGGFDLSRVPRRTILLGFITACDSYSFDFQIAQNCGKGAVSEALGIQYLGAVNNILWDSNIGDLNRINENISSR